MEKSDDRREMRVRGMGALDLTDKIMPLSDDSNCYRSQQMRSPKSSDAFPPGTKTKSGERAFPTNIQKAQIHVGLPPAFKQTIKTV